MDKEIGTIEAKCDDCGNTFDHPDLGDFVYGEFIFCSENGKVHAFCGAFEATAKLIQVLLPEDCGAEMFQAELANLADPILDHKLTTRIHCPNCFSINIESWPDVNTGSIWVKPTT